SVKTTKLGAKVWTCALVFGLVGQIAWSVENMYFATLAQDIFSNVHRQDLATIVSTLMMWLSAIAATATTIFAGGIIDKIGKRKPFIAYGYLAWGATIMLFAAIPMSPTGNAIGLVAALLVIFDCIMTFFGSTANDAAFNTWMTDVTDTTNRGKVNAVMSVFSIVAFVIVFVLAMFLYDAKNASNALFFIVLGAFPIIAGVIAIFVLEDSPNIIKNSNPDYLKETFYGFRPSVIKDNKMLYVCLSASCILGISQQTFFSYLINFILNTLGIKDFILPLAIVIVLAGAFTAVTGMLYDKFGRKHFYIPLVFIVIISTLVIYLMKYMPQSSYVYVLVIAGTFMLGSLLSGGSALMSSFQDYIPKGAEGRFQGVKMCFTVLLPMLIGPLITMIINLMKVDNQSVDYLPPFEIFLAAAIIAVFALIPIFFVRKDSERLRNDLLKEKE
ncbi:MAG: MFS transporter, partial [Clostridia bacterium]|nr:MFS transporter [Clostridia bacterium]